MEVLTGNVIGVLGPIVFLFMVIPILLGVLMLTMVLIWRYRVYRPDPAHTLEGDLAYLARKRRKRIQELEKARRDTRL